MGDYGHLTARKCKSLEDFVGGMENGGEVRQRPENPCVGGSIPPLGTILFKNLDDLIGVARHR
jgi:hypothetical protein